MAPRRSLRSALPALLLAATLGLAACGGDASPAASGTPSSSATGEDSTKPTPASSTAPARNIDVPAMPEAAKQNTKDGFEAFTRYYVDLLSLGYTTGQTEPAKKLAHPGCSMCNTMIEDANNIYSSNRWITGGNLRIASYVTDYQPDINDIYTSIISLEQASFSEYSQSGKAGSDVPTAVIHILARARFSDGAWQMFDLGKAPGSK
jgi:hypothetical protein